MAIYSAYIPPLTDAQNEPDNFRLVSDSKAPLALIFPPFWLAWHRLWLELMIYAVFAIAIALLAVWKPSPPILYLSALPGLFLLLEGNAMIARKLERRGWQFAGVVDGDSLDEAEIRFMIQNEYVTDEPTPKPAVLEQPETTQFRQTPAAVGLFPE